MKDLKGTGRGVMKVLSPDLLGGAEETHGKPQ